MSASNAFKQELSKECIRRINEEGIVRITKCLDLLNEDQIWFKPNNNLNSVGNLCLHLLGNVNQWLIATLGKGMDTRNRESEFDEKNQVSKEELKEMLSTLAIAVKETVDNLKEQDFLNKHNVQCYNETGIAIIVHVIEHFSYHVGQITYYTKLILDTDTKYYTNQNLDQIN